MVGNSVSANGVRETAGAVKGVYGDCGAGGYAVNVNAVRTDAYSNVTIR